MRRIWKKNEGNVRRRGESWLTVTLTSSTPSSQHVQRSVSVLQAEIHLRWTTDWPNISRTRYLLLFNLVVAQLMYVTHAVFKSQCATNTPELFVHDLCIIGWSVNCFLRLFKCWKMPDNQNSCWLIPCWLTNWLIVNSKPNLGIWDKLQVSGQLTRQLPD